MLRARSLTGIVTILITLIAIVASLLASTTQDAEAAGGDFGGGTGEPGNPWLIEDLADLQAMKNDLTAHYALKDSIDLSAIDRGTWNGGLGFEPIGDAVNRFSGSFDGQGFTITGLYINRPNTNNAGLFGHVGHDTEATVIKNVGLVDAEVTGARGTGTLIGRVTGNANTLIEKCYAVGGSVTGDAAAGGLIGSHNSWRETPGGTDNPVVRYSHANVSVHFSEKAGAAAIKFGGLVGCSQKGTIINSYARGSVNVNGGARIGGLAGCIDYRGEIINSYSTGAVNVTNSTLYGGLVGNREGPGANIGVVTNSFWDTQTSGQSTSAGGTGKTTVEMKTESTFIDAGWNFDDIWDIDSAQNDGYPRLILTHADPDPLMIVYITGTFTVQNKVYDGTADATFDTYDLSLDGVQMGHDVHLTDVVIRFSDASVGSDKDVYIVSAALTGSEAGKYMLSLVGAPTATADIYPPARTVPVFPNGYTGIAAVFLAGAIALAARLRLLQPLRE